MEKPQESGLMQKSWTSVTNWGSQNEDTSPESDNDQHCVKQQKMAGVSGLSEVAEKNKEWTIVYCSTGCHKVNAPICKSLCKRLLNDLNVKKCKMSPKTGIVKWCKLDDV
jgi:hypothetical protein